MNEFACVLNEILDQGKKRDNPFTVKELVKEAGIAASYISNLRKDKQKPPTNKTLYKLTDALRKFHVPDTDVQRLLDAYHREQFGGQQDNLLALLTKVCLETGGVLEQPEQNTRRLPPTELVEGDSQTLMLKTIQLLEIAAGIENYRGKIYLTWFHHSFEEHTSNGQQQRRLRTLIMNFLRTDSPCNVLHLWTGNMAKDRSIPVIVNFLKQYLGASNCFLYQIRRDRHLPEYVVVQDVGFIEARPTLEGRYWIHTVLLDEKERKHHPNELTALTAYLEYLLGPEDSRQLLVQTEASLEKFSVTSGTKNLAEAESRTVDKERRFLQSSFSAVYRPAETVRTRLKVLQLAHDRIEAYLAEHRQRIEALEIRLKDGKEISIHDKAFIKRELTMYLPGNPSGGEESATVRKTEADLLKGQIVGVLKAIQPSSNCHIALAEQECPLRFQLAGDTAFFAFDLPESRDKLPFERDELEALAWTTHPDIIYRLRNEFEAMWQAIDPQWRTDTEEGRKNVVNFIVVESLKAMLKENVPGHELYAFASELVDAAPYFDFETYIRELYTQEQAAKEIWHVCYDFPLITLPVNICPWDLKSPLRTRQHLLSALLNQLESFHLITTQVGIEKYWKTGQFGSQTFLRKESTEQHFQYVHDLLLELSQQITIDILPSPEEFLVNFQVIDRKFVCIQKAYEFDEKGGIMLQDKELAQELIGYFERNLSAKCPERLNGAKNVAKWLEDRFLEMKNGEIDSVAPAML